jgi:hypothetical protein
MIPKLITPMAIEALATALRTPVPPLIPPSMLADKFVIRARKKLIEVLEELGTRSGRSGNSEAVCAVTASLAGRHEALTSLNVLKAYLGPEKSAETLQQLTPFDLSTAYGPSKKVVRLPDGTRDAIAHLVDRSVAAGDGQFQSMNAWFLDAVVWWINHQQESAALLKACVDLDRDVRIADAAAR